MRSLGDVLSTKDFIEPDEIKLIKKYVQDKFKEEVGVSIHPKTIQISAPTSALAGTLRMHLYYLRKLCKTDKKLTIKIGN